MDFLTSQLYNRRMNNLFIEGPIQTGKSTLIRTMLGTTSSAVAIPQLISMMEKTETNEQLLIKMKDWFALMNR